MLSSPKKGLSAPFRQVVPGAGVGISFLSETFGRETVAATDSEALRFDEAQIDLGEGPGWDAFRGSRPILEIDLADHGFSLWPLWTDVALAEHLDAVFAFPLRVGHLGLGAVNLYSHEPRDLTEEQVRAASALADAAAVRLLRIAMDEIGTQELAAPTAGYSRREMHQASGMVSVQLGIPVDDALLVIRAQAYAHGRSVREIASDIVSRRVAFAPE